MGWGVSIGLVVFTHYTAAASHVEKTKTLFFECKCKSEIRLDKLDNLNTITPFTSAGTQYYLCSSHYNVPREAQGLESIIWISWDRDCPCPLQFEVKSV